MFVSLQRSIFPFVEYNVISKSFSDKLQEARCQQELFTAQHLKGANEFFFIHFNHFRDALMPSFQQSSRMSSNDSISSEQNLHVGFGENPYSKKCTLGLQCPLIILILLVINLRLLK